MENIISKGRDKYPTMVISAYYLMLDWQPKHGSMQGGSVQRDNHLAFTQQNYQGDGKITANIYKNITCYKCCQLGHYSRSCTFKKYEQENIKDKGSILDNIMQGINRTTTSISSMHVNH